MLYVENNSNDPAYNLALEEFLFKSEDINEPVLLLWQNGPSVIIGRYQNAFEEVDLDYMKKHHIPIVRRSTGGGAVYHDLGNLNFSFIMPRKETPGISGDATDPVSSAAGPGLADFSAFSGPVIRALSQMGIEAVCSGRNDLLIDGRKFSGCAQQRTRDKILHHGTLMFDLDIERAQRILQVDPGKFRSKSVKSVRSRITNLKPLLIDGGCSDTITILDFKNRLLDHFRSEYHIYDHTISKSDLVKVEELKREKYANDQWNLGRSPKADVTCRDFFPCGRIEFHILIDAGKIGAVQITGDFFSSSTSEAVTGPSDESHAPNSVAELELRLAGLPFERSAMLHALEQADLETIFGNVTAKALADMIF